MNSYVSRAFSAIPRGVIKYEMRFDCTFTHLMYPLRARRRRYTFVNPRAMPSRVARPRWVTRESASTASRSFRSRCASMSMARLSGTCDRQLVQCPLGLGPVPRLVDADARVARHHVRDRSVAVQTRLRSEQHRSTKEVHDAVDSPRGGQILPSSDSPPKGLSGEEQRRDAGRIDANHPHRVVVRRH